LQTLVGGPLARVGVGRLRLDRAVAATPEFRELDYFDRIASEFETAVAEHPAVGEDAAVAVAEVPDWSTLSTEDRLAELQIRLQAILGRELRMSPSAISLD